MKRLGERVVEFVSPEANGLRPGGGPGWAVERSGELFEESSDGRVVEFSERKLGVMGGWLWRLTAVEAGVEEGVREKKESVCAD